MVVKRERARYEAERARRQYDAVEPRTASWPARWSGWGRRRRGARGAGGAGPRARRKEQPLARRDRGGPGEDPGARRGSAPGAAAATTTAAERKRLLRLVVKEVVLDQGRERGRVYEDQFGRPARHRALAGNGTCVAYDEHADLEWLERRVREPNAAGGMDERIAAALNEEGFVSARGVPFSGQIVHRSRKRWVIATVEHQRSGAEPTALAGRVATGAGAAGGAGV